MVQGFVAITISSSFSWGSKAALIVNKNRLKSSFRLCADTYWAGGEWMFRAVAEDTSDSVVDGACVASVVSADGQVLRLMRLQGAPKV